MNLEMFGALEYILYFIAKLNEILYSFKILL